MRRQTREQILRASEGIFSTAIDIALWEIFYLAEFAGSFNQRDAYGASHRADRLLNNINYEIIKRALKEARRKRLIVSNKKRKSLPVITREGRRRLESLIPHYDNQRFWDGRIYLVTYDIPEEKKQDRELLREYLKRMGAGMVQESVWLTPYDPQGTLKNFLDSNYLHGLVLISVLEKDSSIGEEDLSSLLRRIYKLEDLNQRYREFIDNFSSERERNINLYFSFLSILKDDPQLPFPLLPPDWLGAKAYRLFREKTKGQS